MPIDSRPRRRSLLAAGTAGAALLLTGCSGSGGTRRAAEHELSSRAEGLRRHAARDSADLLARYDRTIAAHPGLAGRLEPLRADVARHVKAFGGTADRGGTGRPGASASPGAARDAGAPGDAEVPGDARRALAVLAAAERATAGARTRALLDAPPELARLLASVAAAGAVHAYLLTDGE